MGAHDGVRPLDPFQSPPGNWGGGVHGPAVRLTGEHGPSSLRHHLRLLEQRSDETAVVPGVGGKNGGADCGGDAASRSP